ncbi:MAG: 16S rRNA (guanine(527)-N(7))-methyltransferase RsmG [Bdellovibrio sp.]|nr:16S rRNA (guanine(527)-N(7))-methyltransferase RsmG [Bdellovibrio sp.]
MKDNNSNNEQESPTIFWRIEEWFPGLSPDIKSRLKAYHQELIKFNRTVNLISPKTVFVADALHFSDSILAAQTIHRYNPTIEKIYDLGSGNGFPGMIFALLFPKVQVVLVDNDQKKCEFLVHLSRVLNISNVTIEKKNIETLPEGSVQYAMVRGLASISKCLLMMRKPIPKGGVLYHLKGEEWGIEVGEIPTQLCSIWSPSLVGEYKLPIGSVKFSVIKTDKIS